MNNILLVCLIQVSALKNETHNLTQNYNRLNTDFKLAERNNSILTADKATLQQQAGRVEGLERELHQAKWQVTNLEQQLQSQTADSNFRLAQAQSQIQQVQAQAQAQVQQVHAQAHAAQQAAQQAQSRALSMPLPMPMSMPPPPQPMPTYSPAYVPPPPQPARSNPPAQYGGYQPSPSYGSSYSGNTSSAPSLSSLAASSGFNPSANYNTPAYSNSAYPSSSSGSAHKRAASNPVVDSTVSAPFGTAGKSPFANEVTSAQINHVFDDLDRRLTSMMTEKTALQDESERYALHCIC